MAREEKPYRVYRGGRAKGKVPTAVARSGRSPRDAAGGGSSGTGAVRTDYRGPGAPRPGTGRPRWGRRIALTLLVLVILVVVWGVASWLSFSSGVATANKALDQNAKLALAPQNGLLMSHSTTILMLGTDNSQIGGRVGDRHSDSILLLRTDPSHHRLYYLSIPRDIQVPIPGFGTQKINAAFQNGGPALAIKTIRTFTGIDVNHVVVVNFADFKDLINALGGIDVNVPKPIRSNRFDCPYPTQARCLKWQGWRFHKGTQHMSGERALIYSRIRENMLDPSENDITRGARQQAVMEAVASRFTSPSTLIRTPFSGASFVKPLTTDLTAGQLAQLGWVKFRASNSASVHCRLGGDLGGSGTGSPSEDNPATIAMFLGKSAPQPPTDPFGPGCVTGHTLQ
jgi:polyisoprenyl-teichoic acid--peptidoglycan teichoic acid transferase